MVPMRCASARGDRAGDIDVDLEPFSRINPCGFRDLEVTDLRSLGVTASAAELTEKVQQLLLGNLSMSEREVVSDY